MKKVRVLESKKLNGITTSPENKTGLRQLPILIEKMNQTCSEDFEAAATAAESKNNAYF